LNEIPAATQLAKSVGRMKTEKKEGNCWRNVSNEKPHADYSAGYFEKKKPKIFFESFFFLFFG
jgi:hypothetical protein